LGVTLLLREGDCAPALSSSRGLPAARSLVDLPLVFSGIAVPERFSNQSVVTNPPLFEPTDSNAAAGSAWPVVGAFQRPLVDDLVSLIDQVIWL
jgi:hypothetical protein